VVNLQVKDECALRVKIAEQGMNLKAFSTHIGISQAYLSQILSNNRNPSPIVAKKIASGLRMQIDDIFLIKTVAKVNQN
jgi:transcriptional regulator with XRE-family HTH domain